MGSSLCPRCGKAPDAESAPRSPCIHCGEILDRSHDATPTTVAPSAPAVVAVHVGPALPFLGPPRQPDEIGRLGDYRVLSLLGQGGMGVVLLAEDPRLCRRVALKVMRPEFAADPVLHERFLREARSAAAVEHEHVVPVYQVGEDRGVPFLAMQLLRGEALNDRLRREGGPLSVAEVLRVGREIAEGLAAAHAAGLIHRDVKPGNVWLEGERGRVKVLDFGLALPGGDERLTRTGAVVGTPAYMAPEQARGDGVTPRSDLFSLGCVLYEMATGQRPFRGKDAVAVAASVVADQPAPPRRLNPAMPAPLEELILRLLAKAPQARPGSAHEAAAALAAIEEDTAAPPTRSIPAAAPTSQATIPIFSVPATPARGQGRWTLVAGCIGAATLAALVFLLRGWQGAPTPSTEPQPAARSPFDLLSAADISPEDRCDGQPKELVAVLGEHRGRVNGRLAHDAVAVSGDGRLVAVSEGRNEQLCRLLDGETLRPVAAISDTGAGVWLSADGKTLVHNDAALAAVVYDVSNPAAPVRRGRAAGERPHSCQALTPDARTMLTIDKDNTLRLWDLAGADIKERLSFPAGGDCLSARLSHDGKTAAVVLQKREVHVWDVAGAAPRERCAALSLKAGLEFWVAELAPDGGTLAMHAGRDLLRLWDVRGPTPRSRGDLRIAPMAIAAAFAPDGKTLALGRHGHSPIEMWDLSGDKPRKRGEVRGPAAQCACAMAFTAEGQTLISGSFTGVVGSWDLTGAEIMPRVSTRGPHSEVASLAVAPDGKTVAVGTHDSRLWLWGLEAGRFRPLGDYPPPGDPAPYFRTFARLRFTADSATLLGVAGADRVSALWDRVGDGWAPRQPFGCEDAALTPDGKTLATLQLDLSVKVWDVSPTDRKERCAIEALTRNSNLCGVEIAPDGKTVALTEADAVALWDVSGPKAERKLRWADVPGDCGLVLAFSPDGTSLAVGGDEGDTRLWLGPAAGQVKSRVIDEGKGVRCLAFAPDGKALAAVVGGSLVLRETAGGRELRRWSWPGLHRVAFAPDGRHLVAGNLNGTVYVLRL